MLAITGQRRKYLGAVMNFVNGPQGWNLMLTIMNEIENGVVEEQGDQAVQQHPTGGGG